MVNVTKISEKMTMEEVIKANPRTREILAPYHIGVCPSCAFDLKDSLESVAEKNGMPIELLLSLLGNSQK